MFKKIAQKYSNGCFQLVRKQDDSVLFLGTAFLIQEEGYLLTAAHLLENDYENLMIAFSYQPEDFSPVAQEHVKAIDIDVIKEDKTHNIALLKIKRKTLIETPDYINGSNADVSLGNSVLGVGYPFAYSDLHTIGVQHSIIAAKIKLRNETKLYIFDTVIHDGMVGGPLVDIESERIIGMIVGCFDPDDEGNFINSDEQPAVKTNFSYAISIEYGIKLLEDLGLTIS